MPRGSPALRSPPPQETRAGDGNGRSTAGRQKPCNSFRRRTSLTVQPTPATKRKQRPVKAGGVGSKQDDPRLTNLSFLPEFFFMSVRIK